jgi:hypothetical protein
MEYYYVVVENGEVYKHLYRTYKDAVVMVKEKNREHLEEWIRTNCSLELIEEVMSNINVPESPTGVTELYIEKGINIEIRKMSVF